MSVSCLPHPVAVSAFMICRGVCTCTEMLWMCVLYVSFGSKVRPRTFGCIAMGCCLLLGPDCSYILHVTLWNASFKLLFGCVISICCVGFASLDVVCDELNDCAWNVCLLQFSD